MDFLLKGHGRRDEKIHPRENARLNGRCFLPGGELNLKYPAIDTQDTGKGKTDLHYAQRPGLRLHAIKQPGGIRNKKCNKAPT